MQDLSLAAIYISPFVPLVVLVAWQLLKRVRSVRVFRRKFLWSTTFFETVLLVVTAYCLGVVAEFVLKALGFNWVAQNNNQIPLLFLYLAAATGVSRVIEVWLITLHGDRDQIVLSRLSRGALYGTGLSVGLLAFLVSNGYTLLSISTGAIAAGFAFAAQRTMGDLIAGIALGIEGAFRIGDWLQLDDGTEGEVVDIDWRATQLRGWDSAIRTIPNTLLASQSFVRISRQGAPYAQTYSVRVSERENPEIVLSLLTDAVRKTRSILDTPAPAIRLSDATTAPYTYSLWVHFQNYMSMFAGRDELFRNVHDVLREAGLSVSAEVLEVTPASQDQVT